MADPQAVEALTTGHDSWTNYRNQRPIPDLSRAVLGRADLRDANLTGADLSGSKLSGAILSGGAPVAPDGTRSGCGGRGAFCPVILLDSDRRRDQYLQGS
ncbi:pentapeptide repeat-containing protein [Candidatus Neomicrothrix sp.]|jgi:hypothetical protein|uniref:pentapeptide repeat-containing protein n=1 Tax=Candidatus Neomicrothrix sp. TaxID=2719034 RepID=UPI000EE8EAF0|nr:pentapeptide repeat-containing protein [Candidatus Microthrix sp.]HAM23024.1 hypothetical protein [Actinomycetota bacterium]MBP6149628.1 pentapeptide repeat-containing protein [Candidatus Microthrix sp.]MBP7405256.1 pentapeptide repeat-containing protein [Candidatus Microthrix sp.]MBP7852116.1 pentapeptide repeat-containing protein [Candidatus Microthrix sp.]